MRIIETGIPDIQSDNIDVAKIQLADEIVSKISPLFDEAHNSKTIVINESQSELKHKRKNVIEDKNLLESLLAKYNKEKKVKKLLNKISKLVESGLVYDGAVKSETVILLKIIPNLASDKVDHHLAQVSSVLRKRFG